MFVGWEGEMILSILTTTRLRGDVGLCEDCGAWNKFRMSKYISSCLAQSHQLTNQMLIPNAGDLLLKI